MGFLDIFSGKQARQTAMANSALASQTFGNLNTMLGQNRDQAQQYITNANEAVQNRYNAAKPEMLGALSTSLDQARGALAGGYNQARTDVTGGYNQARADLSGGYDAARGTLGQATHLMEPYIAAGASADTLYGGAIGLGGAAGGEAARGAFQEAPGTQYQINRASEEAARRAGSLGMAGSGETLNAIRGQAQQTANTGWNAWLDRLKGVGDRGYNASTGQANLYGAIADTQAKEGQQLGNYAAASGTQLGNYATGYGTAGANLEAQGGRDQASVIENLLRGQSTADLSTGTQLANTQQSTANSVANLGTQLLGIQIGQADKAQAAGDAAAANQFGAIMAGLKAAAGIATAPIGGALGGPISTSASGATQGGTSLFGLGANKLASAWA
jgi:hypothetical protein